MPVLMPKRAGIVGFNGAPSGRPVGQDLRSLWYARIRGVPRYEDLLTPRLMEMTHTISIPLDAVLQQIVTTPWTIAATVDIPTSRHESAADAAIDLLDGSMSTTFDDLCKMWLTDCLSIGTGVLELVPDDDGMLLETYVRDGATFTKNPDSYGRLPPPGSDEPAYYQVGAQMAATGYGGMAPRSASGLMRLEQMQALASGALSYRGITPIPFSRDQLVWIEENPKSWRLYAQGRVQRVSQLVEIILNQDASNLRYFPANEIPEGILNLVDLNANEIDRFREYWRDEVEGKPYKLPIVGVKSAQWIPFRATLQDLQFLESQRWYHHLVWMTFGLNPNEVGDLADVNRSTAQEQAETVWRRTTVPLLELLANVINHRVVPFMEAYWDVDGELQFLWDPSNPILKRQRRAEQESDLRLGLSTPNRILVERGEAPVPWGDMPLVLTDSLARMYPEWFASEICGIESVPEPLYGGGLLLSSQAHMTKAAPEDEPEEWQSRIGALHRRVAGVFEDALQALRPAIEEAFPADVPEGDPRPAVDLDAVLDKLRIADDLLVVTADPRADALQHGIDLERRRLEEEIEGRIGKGLYRVTIAKEFDVTRTFAFRLLQQRAARNMRGVEDSVRGLVRTTLARVVEEGGNANDAWLALQRDVPDMTSNHARLVARTEIMGAQRYGKQALAEEVEHLLKGKTWRSRKIPGRSRAWHMVMDGVTVPVRDSWTVPALGVKGQPADYPKQCYIVGEDQPFGCMCDQRLALADDLPATAQELRSIKGVTVAAITKQAAVLLEHGRPHETLQALLQRWSKDMSKNQMSESLGISKATLYEWLRQE